MSEVSVTLVKLTFQGAVLGSDLGKHCVVGAGLGGESEVTKPLDNSLLALHAVPKKNAT